MDNKTYSGTIVDVVGGRVFEGSFEVVDQRICSVSAGGKVQGGKVYLPGFVDAHIHIESSMLAPTEFARVASIHGTVATVSDPHEIANVCGLAGVHWMLANAALSKFKFFFGAPSCVPATTFETSGAAFELSEIEALLQDERISYLSEVMNFPAVINRDPRMLEIIALAKRYGKRIDGHAPGVVGDALKAYASAGIETDHECVTLTEARERVALGMKVAIREGSAARNFDALWPLLKEAPEACFFCSDDKHPDELVCSHIDALIRRAVQNGISPMTAIRAATLNPVRHYRLPVGLLQEGDPADFVEVDDLEHFKVQRTFINGVEVAAGGQPLLPRVETVGLNKFEARPIGLDQLAWTAPGLADVPVILAQDGALVTGREAHAPLVENGKIMADPGRDLLKIVVVNRYRDAPPAIGLIKHFGLKRGALASSVAHDSHNVVAVGASDEALLRAINAVIEARGGLAFASPSDTRVFPLPIAGLMAEGEAWEAAEAFKELSALARADGCKQSSPYMTLSFMALLVIPSLKMSDLGLFDVDRFDFWKSSDA